MIAYHGQAKLKATYLARVRAHKRADEIIHGTYWENGKGCAVGCTIHSSNHAAYETELGVPRILARLEDRIFEGMGNGKASKWPVDFLSAIRVGADLSLVWPRFAVWLLVDKRHGVIRYAKNDQQRSAIQRVAKLYGKVIAGETVSASDWRPAAAAAYAAAAAAYAAADADAAAAAAAAAYAAAAYAAAAYAAAAAAAAADAAYAARRRSYERMSVKLLALLKAAPVRRKPLSSPGAAPVSDWYPVAWQRMDAVGAVRIERMVSPFYDGERFAVRDMSWCLNTRGEWEYEPIPSSRDDAFYARCRFPTIDAAIAALASVDASQESPQ